jgi:hypothetical protein
VKVEHPTIARLQVPIWLTDLGQHSSCKSQILAIACTTSLFLNIGSSGSASAQSSLIPTTPEICDINLTLLNSTQVGTDPNIVTANTASPQGTTIPSLWWTSEQFPAKLVTNWIANRRQNQIYLLVNTQYWNILDYIDRYRTIDRFGRVAQSYGYNLKICNSQKIALARYTCSQVSDPSSKANSTAISSGHSCQIWLNTNENGMGVRAK